MIWIYIISALVMMIVSLKVFTIFFSGAFLNLIMRFIHSNLETVKMKLFDEAISNIKNTKKNSGNLEILELGIGTGENFRHFPKGSNDLNVSKLVVSKAEEMVGIESNSMDVVVHTFILCSVDDNKKVMNEIYRILKSDGVCIFMEHSVDLKKKPKKYIQSIIGPLITDCKFINMEKVLSSGPYDHLELKFYQINKFWMTLVNPIIYGYGLKKIK
ncbi:methyltransferase 7A [Brachionus plicatilis]|uniref:Methyltransferase 7A n=1 Tax=Brachionus plicatilis TaxID=10195 RepID=A0A3M7TB06_BRAPC|nr:methyltransferase 7A [Brachionus plicatilis]